MDYVELTPNQVTEALKVRFERCLEIHKKQNPWTLIQMCFSKNELEHILKALKDTKTATKP